MNDKALATSERYKAIRRERKVVRIAPTEFRGHLPASIAATKYAVRKAIAAIEKTTAWIVKKEELLLNQKQRRDALEEHLRKLEGPVQQQQQPEVGPELLPADVFPRDPDDAVPYERGQDFDLDGNWKAAREPPAGYISDPTGRSYSYSPTCPWYVHDSGHLSPETMHEPQSPCYSSPKPPDSPPPLESVFSESMQVNSLCCLRRFTVCVLLLSADISCCLVLIFLVRGEQGCAGC